MSIDILLILQTSIILVFDLPRDFEKNFGCSVPYSRIIPGPKQTESYNSLSWSQI